MNIHEEYFLILFMTQHDHFSSEIMVNWISLLEYFFPWSCKSLHIDASEARVSWGCTPFVSSPVYQLGKYHGAFVLITRWISQKGLLFPRQYSSKILVQFLGTTYLRNLKHITSVSWILMKIGIRIWQNKMDFLILWPNYGMWGGSHFLPQP